MTIKEATDRLAGHCPRLQGKECRTRACFVENGWDRKTVPIPIEAACYEKQLLDYICELESKIAGLEKVKDLEPF